MPQWWVSEPYISLRLEDEPLGYEPALGPKVTFHISYRQRGALADDPRIFGVGPNWSSSFLSYVAHLSSDSTDVLRLHGSGAGWVKYTVGTAQPLDGSIITTTASGYKIEFADGSTTLFEQTATDSDGQTRYFETSQADPEGNALTFTYAAASFSCLSNTIFTNLNFTGAYFIGCSFTNCFLTNCCFINCYFTGGYQDNCSVGCACPGANTVFRLTGVTDADGRTTTIQYDNPEFPNRITTVADPFNRTNKLRYNESGFLTNTVDVFGLATSFKYDTGASANDGWLTNMTTPYGTTSFKLSGEETNAILRFAEISPPFGGKHLYVYRDECTNFMPATYSPLPNTAPFTNKFDNVDQNRRNSFVWTPLQYAGLSSDYLLSGNVSSLTSNDFAIARLRHWLAYGDPPFIEGTSHTLSLERVPSPDGTTPGQITWYDYAGKSLNGSNFVSSSSAVMPTFKALILPDGSTRYTYTQYGAHREITNEVTTYSKTDGTVGQRTNRFYFATNGIDLKQHIGPQGEQVVSNYFGNAHHKADASYDALNQQRLMTYNATWQLTSTKTPASLTTTNIYFSGGTDVGRLDKNIDLEIKRTNSYTYYTNGLVRTHTDERGMKVTNFWDNLQRLTGVRYPDASTSSNIYTLLDLTATKDRLGYWNYSGYSPIRQKLAETNANNVVTRYGYCDCGALLYQTNAWATPVEQVTSYGYDFQGNRTYERYADAHNVTNWFNAVQQVYQTGDGAAYTYFYFNNQGLLTNRSNAYGTESATIFDSEDRALRVTDSNGVIVTNAYDSLGRLITRTYPDQGVELFGYSARGMIVHTNQIGFASHFGYDEAGRKIVETNANSEIIRYTNNAAGDLLSLTDGKVQTTKWNYDEYGRVTNKLDQAGAEVLRYAYDAGNRLTDRWSAAMGDTGYSYDAVGNLTTIDYPTSPDVTFEYDWLDRVTNMVDALGTTKYTYSAGNQVLTEDGPFGSDTITNTYVNRLRTRLSLQQPTGAWTNLFVYDAAKRLTNVTSPAGAFAYSLGATAPSSRLIQKLLLPNTAAITNAYDSVARLTKTHLRTSSGTLRDKHEYVYDPANERTNQTRGDGSTVAYTYDSIGQLTIADSSVGGEDRGYFYDAAWNLNRRTNDGTPEFFTVDDKNQTTTVPGGHPTEYDDNGNLVYQEMSPGDAGYFYDDENRLIDYYLLDGINDLHDQFVYDGLGRLRQILTYHYYVGQGWVKDLGEAWRIYDGMRVIQERDQNNTPTVSYTRGTDLSGSLEGTGGIGGMLARSDSYSSGNWTNHSFCFADANGNITYLLDGSQVMAASYRYDPFGNTISKSGLLADANVYRFSSKEIHVNTGMYYYGYRFYDPNLQRWISGDPLSDMGFERLRLVYARDPDLERDGKEPNLYQFAANCPTTRTDPLGLKCCITIRCSFTTWAAVVPSPPIVLGVPPAGTIAILTVTFECYYNCKIQSLSGSCPPCYKVGNPAGTRTKTHKYAAGTPPMLRPKCANRLWDESWCF